MADLKCGSEGTVVDGGNLRRNNAWAALDFGDRSLQGENEEITVAAESKRHCLETDTTLTNRRILHCVIAFSFRLRYLTVYLISHWTFNSSPKKPGYRV